MGAEVEQADLNLVQVCVCITPKTHPHFLNAMIIGILNMKMIDILVRPKNGIFHGVSSDLSSVGMTIVFPKGVLLLTSH